jgi:hypothetical protein
MPSESLSLYTIDSQLEELIEYRQSRIEDPDSLVTVEELAAVDGEIERYMAALTKKVDGVAGLLLRWKGQREAIVAERGRLKTLLERIEGRDARLRDYVTLVMSRQPAPAKGSRRLRGNTSELLLRANGGPAPLLVNQPELVPDELKTVEVTLRYDLWQQLLRGAAGELADRIRADVKQKITPSNALIRQELEKTGSKSVAGAYLGDRGSWIEIR